MKINLLTPFKKNDGKQEFEVTNRISRIWYLRKHYINILKKYTMKIGLIDTIRTQFPLYLKDAETVPMLSVELTNNCNLKCPYCSSPKK